MIAITLRGWASDNVTWTCHMSRRSRLWLLFYGDFDQQQIWQIRKSLSTRHHCHSNHLMRSYYHANSHVCRVETFHDALSAARVPQRRKTFSPLALICAPPHAMKLFKFVRKKSFRPRARATKKSRDRNSSLFANAEQDGSVWLYMRALTLFRNAKWRSNAREWSDEWLIKVTPRPRFSLSAYHQITKIN